jgi:hypothetical protein
MPPEQCHVGSRANDDPDAAGGTARPGQPVSWEQFDARYRPILIGFARRLGTQREDASNHALCVAED